MSTFAGSKWLSDTDCVTIYPVIVSAVHDQDRLPEIGGRLRPGRQRVRLAAIALDGGTQVRAALNEVALAEYAEALAKYAEDAKDADAEFPPVIVYQAEDLKLWLADGFHRVETWRRAGRESIMAIVHDGSLRDAILYAVGANRKHGLQRSNADKRRAVERLLCDPEWGQWSDREVADRCAVSHPYVGKVRAELAAAEDAIRRMRMLPLPRTTGGASGNGFQMGNEAIPTSESADVAQPVVVDAPADSPGEGESSESEAVDATAAAGRTRKVERNGTVYEMKTPVRAKREKASAQSVVAASPSVLEEFRSLWARATGPEREEIRVIVGSADGDIA